MSPENFKHSEAPEQQLSPFAELRAKSHAEMDLAVKERTEKNPKPSDHELRIGAYEEVIEPQMRPVLKELYKKGYTTESSGFGGIDGEEIQQVDGYFEIDPQTEEELKEVGAWVTRQEKDYQGSILTRIEFKSDEPDMNKITEKWMEIVNLLPTIGKESYAMSAPSNEFRREHLGEDEARRILIETGLERNIIDENEREEAEAWLADYRKKHPNT